MSLAIFPSMMCADWSHVAADVRELDRAGADGFHMDIMDGMFVPNITFGPLMVEAVAALTTKPVDAHLMIEQPDRYIPDYAKAGASIIVVHAEACTHLQRSLSLIRECGARPGVALNPHTPVNVLENVLDDLSLVLVMTVNPGYAGQQLIPACMPKIRQVADLLAKTGHTADILVDGNMNEDTIPQAVAEGATMVVGGSALFVREAGLAASLQRLRRAAQAG